MTVKRYIRKITKWVLATVGVLIVGLLLIIGGIEAYYKWIRPELTHARIERITEISVPRFEMFISRLGYDFLYDPDAYQLYFHTTPSDELFDEIDKKIVPGNTNWKRNGNEYTFSIKWGDGYPAPKGESEDEIGKFSFSITKGKDVGYLIIGVWEIEEEEE